MHITMCSPSLCKEGNVPEGLFYGIIWFYIFAITTMQLTWSCKFMREFSIETQTRSPAFEDQSEIKVILCLQEL